MCESDTNCVNLLYVKDLLNHIQDDTGTNEEMLCVH